MKISTKFNPAYHLVYIFILTAAISWWQGQSTLSTGWTKYVKPVNNNLCSIISRQNNQYEAVYEKLAMDYPARDYDLMASKSELFQEKLHAITRNTNFLILTASTNIRYRLNDLDTLRNDWKKLGQILKAEALSDSSATVFINVCFAESMFDRWELLYKKSNAEERKFLSVSLQRMVNEAVFEVLYDKSNYLHYNQNMWINSVKLVMNTNMVPVTGVSFKVSLEPVWYSSGSWDNSWININNRRFKFKNGVANCEVVFDSPGIKSLSAILEIKNPATGHVETTTKTFQIEVTK